MKGLNSLEPFISKEAASKTSSSGSSFGDKNQIKRFKNQDIDPQTIRNNIKSLYIVNTQKVNHCHYKCS